MHQPANYVALPLPVRAAIVYLGGRCDLACALQRVAGTNSLSEAIVSAVIVILGLVFFGGVVVFSFMGMMVVTKDARPPRVREIKRAPRSSPMSRIHEFADLCTVTSTDVAGLRRGRLGL